MRTVAVISLLLACAFANNLLTKEFIHEINSAQSQWVATEDNIFKNMSIEEIKARLGTNLRPLDGVNQVSYESLLDLAAVPSAFDSRTQWKDCVHEIRDQAKCGSCWAFGASESFSDRVCIASAGKTNSILSPQYLVACDEGNYGCQGGYLTEAWDFIESTGLPSDTCVPYTAGTGTEGTCPSTCTDGSDITFIKGKNVRSFRKADDAKLDIMTNGPIETGFQVYQDFITYATGIYKHTKGTLLGGHAIKVVGWGVEDNVKYWIAANSWGPKWGETGFFRIQEGQCGFEGQMIGADADI